MAKPKVAPESADREARARAWIDQEIAGLAMQPAQLTQGRLGRLHRHLARLDEIGPSYVSTIEAEMPLSVEAE